MLITNALSIGKMQPQPFDDDTSIQTNQRSRDEFLTDNFQSLIFNYKLAIKNYAQNCNRTGGLSGV